MRNNTSDLSRTNGGGAAHTNTQSNELAEGLRARRWRAGSRILVVAATVVALAVASLGMASRTGAARAATAEELAYRFGPGYWLASSDGGLFAYGHAGFHGSAAADKPRRPIAAIAATRSGEGYWMVSADGGVYAYGDATFYGAANTGPLMQPIVGIAPTPSNRGYWLVAADGGVFAYGDASFIGAAGNLPLRRAIVGIAATPTGGGYWLVAADGGVFAYGDAGFIGSPAAESLRAPIVGITATTTGLGYWLVGSDGGVFAYGDAGFFGSPASEALRRPIVGLAGTPGNDGYWMASADGNVFVYGDAGFYGAMAGQRLTGRIVGIAGGFAPARRQIPTAKALSSSFGYDVSWPQCPSDLPAKPFGYGVVGVTGGRAFTANPCLAALAKWSRSGGSGGGLYMNLNFPSDGGWSRGAHGPAGDCSPGDAVCVLTNFGANAVTDAVELADREGARAPLWWLDVETMNYWSPDTALNSRIVQGAIDELLRRKLSAGIYSTGYQWGLITGSYAPGVPVWPAGAPDMEAAAQWCGRPGFGGGPVYMVQLLPGQYDTNLACAPTLADPGKVFQLPSTPVAPVLRRPVVRFQ